MRAHGYSRAQGLERSLQPQAPIIGPVQYQPPPPQFQALPYQTPHFRPLTISGPPHLAPIPKSNPSILGPPF